MFRIEVLLGLDITTMSSVTVEPTFSPCVSPRPSIIFNLQDAFLAAYILFGIAGASLVLTALSGAQLFST